MSHERSPQPAGPELPGGPERAPRPQGWAALKSALFLAPSAGRLVAALLLGLLGFAVAVQVRSTQASGLDALRQSDLVRILDDTAEQSARLRSEAAQLEETRRRLSTGTDGSRTAIEEARRRADTLGILAGTLPAQGPGIVLTVRDPDHTVTADQILDAVEELRDAGAEALQIGSVRIVASTAFVDAPAQDGGIVADGVTLSPPYRLTVIGDPRSLSTGLEIPGGVDETLRGQGADPVVAERDSVQVTALRPLQTPQYARPTPTPSG